MGENERNTGNIDPEIEENEINEGRKIPIWAHLIAIGVIIAVVAGSAIALWRWNQGTAVVEENTGESYEIEVLDLPFLLPEEKKAGHTFDDVETILFLGNDAITYDMKESGFTGQVSKKLGATCINAGFPGSTITNKNKDYSDEYPLDAFSFYNVAKAISDEDYSQLLSSAEKFEDSTYDKSAETLAGLDFDKVDTLVIFYNAQDYLNGRIGLNPDNKEDVITYSGALYSGIKLIQDKYPYIRIVCMSFPMCYAYNSSGELVSGDRVDFGNGKLTTYLQFMIDVSGDTGVSFIDNYYGTIDEDNSSEWLLDNVHVNAACNEHMAQHFINVIYPESDVAEE
ncbi:SGNH/GDSL hydrolase family protein [Butyrivibrio sp. X503]|uniref:SGNH/GDSL hydrolase family protein n=1 Tax=Butyrivibrio sp. X503 TaxID=2364878 RepID=UPI000EAA55CC|nr:SGNH/GDSL hydrolase family protein [Butyrivibrio sp. X503]RKM54493.1 SGNH/GDSL hydrolase family protein [Butyrivibrio sp. X503]